MEQNTITIHCTNLHRDIEIPAGATLLQLTEIISDSLGFTPICALVNNKIEGLDFRIHTPKIVEYLPLETSAGRRTYIRSLCMMLYDAVSTLLPDTSLRIAHSLSRGVYCRLSGIKEVTPELCGRLKEHISRLVSLDIPFRRFDRRTFEVIEIFRRQHLDNSVRLLDTLHELYTPYCQLGDLCDSYYGPLAPSTSAVSVFDLIPYKEGLLLMGPSASDPSRPERPIEQEKMYRAFTDYLTFNRIIGVSNVGELNQAVEAGNSSNIINVSEALHNNRIANIAGEITRRHAEGGARVVLIAGPSSSGKTTFTKRLAIQLMTNLLVPQIISLDDYFVDRHHTPKDTSGDYDYESLYALDLATFNDHLNRLIQGQEVEIPYYNFETGSREYRGHRISLSPDSILLIEGIHGLNPELTSAVDERMKYRVYVSALTSISIDDHNWIPTTDNRLLRRIIRDARYRGVSPEQTIRRWPSVRRGEERWIFPYQENADAMFNSSLLFEMGVMKQRGEALLRRVPHDVSEYAEADRLRRFLGYFTPISEEHIPSTSLLREFLGGSSFKY